MAETVVILLQKAIYVKTPCDEPDRKNTAVIPFALFSTLVDKGKGEMHFQNVR